MLRAVGANLETNVYASNLQHEFGFHRLNLLLVFDALMTERHATAGRPAHRLSQPAVSAA